MLNETDRKSWNTDIIIWNRVLDYSDFKHMIECKEQMVELKQDGGIEVLHNITIHTTSS